MKTLKDFFHRYIENTLEKAVVADKKVFLCLLTVAVCKGVSIKNRNVYATARMLKHLYDKKPAEEFMFLLDNLHKIVKYPDKIYKNKDAKRGCFCFVKRIGNFEYLGSLEIVVLPIKFGATEFGEEKKIQIATVFRLRDEK